MDDDADAVEAFERKLFQIDGDRDSSDSDKKELEEILYSNSHYASDLSREQSLIIDKNAKNDSIPQDKHEVEPVPVQQTSSAEKTKKTRKSNTKRYYDIVDEKEVRDKYKETGHVKRDCKSWMKDVVCYNCNKTGHFSRDCESHKVDIVCYSCNETGHIARDCKNNTADIVSYNSESYNKDILCYNCNERGHISRECRTIVCYICNKTGHVAKECQGCVCSTCGEGGHVPEDCKNTGSNKYKCFDCGDAGHIARNCPNTPNSPNRRTISKLVVCHCCGKTGHFARDCLDANDQIERCRSLDKINDRGKMPLYTTKWSSQEPLGTFKNTAAEKEVDISLKNAETDIHEELKRKRIDKFRTSKSLVSTDDILKLKVTDEEKGIPFNAKSKETQSIENNEVRKEKMIPNDDSAEEVDELKKGPLVISNDLHSINSRKGGAECVDKKKIDLAAKSVSSSVNSLVESLLSTNDVVLKPISSITNSKKMPIELSSDDHDEITVTNVKLNVKNQNQRLSKDVGTSNVINLLSDSDTSMDNQTTKLSDISMDNQTTKLSDISMDNQTTKLGDTSLYNQFTELSDISLDNEVTKRSEDTNDEKRKKKNSRKIGEYSPHVDLGIDDDGSESKSEKRKRRRRRKRAKASPIVHPIVHPSVHPSVQEALREARVIVKSVVEKDVKNTNVKVKFVSGKDVKNASVKGNSDVDEDVKDTSTKLDSPAEGKVKRLKKILDHETLNNLRDILWDSGDDDEFCDAGVIPDHLLLPNINVDSTITPDDGILTKSDPGDEPCFRDRINNNRDGTHYNPTELRREHLDAYGVHISPMREPQPEIENRKLFSRKRRRQIKDSPTKNKKKKQKVTSVQQGKSVLRTLKKNFSCNNHNTSFSPTPEQSSSRTKTKTEERGFLFRKVGKKDVIVLD